MAVVLFVRLRSAATSAATALPTVTPADYALAADPSVLQLSPELALQLVTVPAGKFVMGTVGPNAEVDRNEFPQHTVYLDEYQIGQYEVTVAQWRTFVQATGYEGAPGALVDPDDYPVCFVNWDDAMAFCSWASQLTGRNVSLPTEAQWEKAARGEDGRTYPWGEDTPTCALSNYYAESACVNYRAPVGSCSPAGDGPYGCADIVGNVWEWAHDWYDPGYYASSPMRNPQGPSQGMFRVLRGGGWVSNHWRMRVAFRFRGDASFRCADLGFRVCVTPD